MRYVQLIAAFVLVCCIAPVATAAPSISGVSPDRQYFNSDTSSVDIHYSLSDISNGCTVVSIYGPYGKAKDLFSGTQDSGPHSLNWDGTNGYGVPVPDGEYTVLAHLESADGIRQPQLIKVISGPNAGDGQMPRLAGGSAVNSSGFRFTVDTANDTVLVFSPGGARFSRFGGSGGDDGLLDGPGYLAINATDYVFVSDCDNARVQAFDPAGQFVAGWPVSAGQEAEDNHSGPVAIDSQGNVYVAVSGEKKLDNSAEPWTPGFQNFSRIQAFSPSGELLRSFGSYGSGEGQFGQISGLAVGPSDDLYVADLQNHRALVLDREGHFIVSWDHTGISIGDSYGPAEIGVNSSGCIYTADSDNGCIEAFSPIVVGRASVVADDTPPQIEAVRRGAAKGGWYNASVSISLKAADGGSGVREIYYALDGGQVERMTGDSTALVIANGMHALDYWSVDNVGNEGARQSLAVTVDTIPPVTGARLTGVTGANGWYRSDVNVSLTADDVGSGVALTQYDLDGSGWLDGTSFTVTGDGRHTLYIRSIDSAGNLESARPLNVSIDQTPPSVIYSLDGPSSKGWFTSSVTATLFPADGCSGITAAEYSLDGIVWKPYQEAIRIQPENRSQLYYRAWDVAGNVLNGSTFVFFWPTGARTGGEKLSRASGPALEPGVITASPAPASPLLPAVMAPLAPDGTYVPARDSVNWTGMPSDSDASGRNGALIEILKIVAGFTGFLP